MMDLPLVITACLSFSPYHMLAPDFWESPCIIQNVKILYRGHFKKCPVKLLGPGSKQETALVNLVPGVLQGLFLIMYDVD
jgi:hypothetical protein